MPRLAVLILTFNEEIHIADCIKSVDFADEVVVIDSGSTDKTAEIARALGAKVVFHPMNEGFAAQRNFALTCTDADWVLYLDADERITPELAEEIKIIIKNPNKAAYAVPRKFMMYGKWVKSGGLYPDYTLRLFPKEAELVWQGSIHESAMVKTEKKNFKNALLHYGFRGWEPHLNKDNKYTSMLAEKLYKEGKRSSAAKIVVHPLWAFIRMFFIYGGFRDGLLGLILASFRYFYTLQKYVKLYYYDKPLFKK